MAWIKKTNARKELERDIPTASVSNWPADGGLRFNMQIGLHKVSLTHLERDIIVAQWNKMQAEHEK